MFRRSGATLALAAAAVVVSAGCSPLLYIVLQARHGDSHPDLVLDRPMSGSTQGAGDSYSPSCIHDDGRDEAWTFTAPGNGTYWFRVTGDYDTALAVYQNDGREMACNDDHGSTRESEVAVSLHQGERYTAVIDGYGGAAGSYTVTVTDHEPSLTPTVAGTPAVAVQTPIPADAPGMAARCETAEVLTQGVLTGTLDPAVHTATVTCGDHGPGGDMVYRFEASAPGTLSVAESSYFDALLELRSGCDPGHTVLACADDVPDTRHSAVSAHLAPGTYYLVVDAYSPTGAGPFALLVDWRPDALNVPPPVSPPRPETRRAKASARR